MAAGTAQAEAPTRILVNGKIVTVDDQFSIQQAVAISGERIVAVGSDAQIRALAGPGTEVSDLGGRTVLPGWWTTTTISSGGTEYWTSEMRLEGVTSRARIPRTAAGKGPGLPKGQWLLTLGGWYEDQLAGDRRD